MEIAGGKVVDISPDGYCTIRAVLPNIDRAILRQYSKVQIGFADGRTITPEQRRKAYALMNEIASWMGDLPEYVKRLMKMDFMVTRMQALQKQIFSLSDCDVTTAREFINYLIDFIIEHDVPTQTPLIELCEDISKYVYACLMHKKCAVCGKSHADLHHCEGGVVGMGNDRTKVNHIGRPALPLCREHHTVIHQVGQADFLSKYHLVTVPIDKKIAKIYRLKAGED